DRRRQPHRAPVRRELGRLGPLLRRQRARLHRHHGDRRLRRIVGCDRRGILGVRPLSLAPAMLYGASSSLVAEKFVAFIRECHHDTTSRSNRNEPPSSNAVTTVYGRNAGRPVAAISASASTTSLRLP